MRTDRRRSRALLSFPPHPSFPSFCSGQALALFPSYNCHPTQSLVLRDVQGLPFVSPDTRCPSLLHPPPPFATLPRSSLSSLFHGASYPRFADSFSSSGPLSAVLRLYLAEPRILFARVIVLRAHIPGETRAQSGISATCSLSAMDSNIAESTEGEIRGDLITMKATPRGF